MEAAQSRLKAKVNAWEAAVAAEVTAEAHRDEAQRITACLVREFGFTTLSASGNHHNEDPYLLYYPDGYGDATRRKAAEIAEFCRVALEKLAEETDPKILSYREQLAAARESILSTEEAYVTALNARQEAFERLQAERRAWVRGLSEARALAEAACFNERAYVRAIFAPADATRRRGQPEPAEGAAAPASAERPATGPQNLAA
jgi:hypothetical protein